MQIKNPSTKNALIFLCVTVLFLIPIFTNTSFSDDDIEELLNKAYESEEIGNRQEAVKYFDQVLQLDPNNIEALNGKGILLLVLGDKDQSLEHLDKALKINPNYVNALINKGVFLGEEEKFDEALEYFNKALNIEPENSKALVNKANVYTFLGDFDEALELLDKVLKNEPNNIEAIKNKQTVFDAFGFQHFDGILQTIIRDKNGNLVGYLESDRISASVYSKVYEKILSWEHKTLSKPFLRDGVEYELVVLESSKIGERSFVQTGYGLISLDNKPQNATLQFKLLNARLHGVIVEPGDKEYYLWQLLIPR